MGIHDIEQAKKMGKILRSAREEQGHNLAILAGQCQMSVVQLVALEYGNVNIFDKDHEKMQTSALAYANVLGLDISILNASNKVLSKTQREWTGEIPLFLRKKDWFEL